MLELKTYKNWKEICKAMNWCTTGGTYKQARMKELDSICMYHKEGYKIVIDEIFAEPKEIEDGRKNNKGEGKKTSKVGKSLPMIIIDDMKKEGIGMKDIAIYELKDQYLFISNNSIAIRTQEVIKEYLLKYSMESYKYKEQDLWLWSKEVLNDINNKIYAKFDYIMTYNVPTKDKTVKVEKCYRIKDSKGQEDIFNDEFTKIYEDFKTAYCKANNIFLYGHNKAINYTLANASEEQREQCKIDFLKSPKAIRYFREHESINGLMFYPEKIKIICMVYNISAENLERVKLLPKEVKGAIILETKVELVKAIKKSMERFIKKTRKRELEETFKLDLMFRILKY